MYYREVVCLPELQRFALLKPLKRRRVLKMLGKKKRKRNEKQKTQIKENVP